MMNKANGRAKPAMAPPGSGVTVRMYNPGFGDCFLLAFPSDDGEGRYMMIDCGVHHQYPGGEERMKLIVEDIARASGGRLDVVAVTHEHTDHILGFSFARDAFGPVEIKDLWLAWTEDDADPLVQSLKELHARRMSALASAVHRLGVANSPLAASLQPLLEFEADAAGGQGELGYLREKCQHYPTRSQDYCIPGQAPRALPGVKGVKFYVLGPPRDLDMMKKLQKKAELYPEFAAMDDTAAFEAALAAAGPLSADEETRFRQSCPFDVSLGIPREEAMAAPFFNKHYGFDDANKDAPSWRRIDNDWMGWAGELALSINSLTNNTSLVLAIELADTEPHKVLLFVGDAQVGNWLSWHKVSFPGEAGAPVSGTDLVRRTVLYKVGHHGSRNATLSVRGLEIMDHADLVAMIPVNEKWARNEKHWEHPAAKLLKRLEEATAGRVIRSDQIPPPAEGEKQAFVEQLQWDEGPDRLWIQYTVKG